LRVGEEIRHAWCASSRAAMLRDLRSVDASIT